MKKHVVPYKLKAPKGGVELTGGRSQKAFQNNISFLKGFDLDRMLYWYRIHKGKPAPGVPYASDAGHFENNLKGDVYVDIYASSKAHLPLDAGDVVLSCETSMPDDGKVRITIEMAAAPFRLHLRMPRWALWCHTPEGISYRPELMVSRHFCMHCGKCEAVCSQPE